MSSQFYIQLPNNQPEVDMPYKIQKPYKTRKSKISENGGLVTFDEFYEIADEKIRTDLLDGKIIRDSPGVPRHAFVISWLTGLLIDFTQKFDLGAVLCATVTVRLTIYNSPEPDIFFISKKRLGIINEKFVNGPPDLCIEVISKSSRKYDRGRKFVLYAEHSVKEYWIIDPLRNTVDWFENLNGQFVPILPDAQGRLHSNVLPGFWLKPEWLSADPLPVVLEVLREILGERQPLVQFARI
jgi:Uma2 family endonuclease